MKKIVTPYYALEICGADGFLVYSAANGIRKLNGPVFEVDGELLEPHFTSVSASGEKKLNEVLDEYRFEAVYEKYPALRLSIIIRVSEYSPIIRFRYELRGDGKNKLTKTGGEKLDYCSFAAGEDAVLTEVRFSEFNEMYHSFCMNEVVVRDSFFANECAVMGPLLAVTDDDSSCLLAYEHGSQYPDSYVNFRFGENRSVTLSAKKGNYLSNTVLDEEPFETIWFDFGAVSGNIDDLAEAFREFLLKYSTIHTSSRTPYIFYNTWCFQERNKFWNGNYYLSDMHEERMLSEIDAAHEMGIDVFVIDTGWYEKTGDWAANRERFADGLKTVKARLDSYGMKLGLWIGPVFAAVSSRAYTQNKECMKTWDNNDATPFRVWETEESFEMCLVSRYHDVLADTLIGLARELGVSYFKWDSIGQYGCNSELHDHGDLSHTPEERAEVFSFRMSIYMEKIVEKVCEACPGVIIDFDVTEGDRSVGLGFLSAGKYFLINNGPYFQNYSIPYDHEKVWSNIFVHPGAPRTWICRMPLTFDKWIPSILFLTHYLPDDPIGSQDINLASLILGQNGIWGDLPAVSAEGKARFASVLSKYKQVRGDITAEGAVKTGMTGSGFECYEKICSKTGRGVVSIFSNVADTFSCITSKKTADSFWTSVPAEVTHLADGTSRIEVKFTRPGAAMIFFGV